MGTILVADDDPGILGILKMRLELEDYKVIAVETATAALTAVETHTLELAIIDLQLGNENGIQLMKQVKKIRPDLPVIILTAHGTIKNAVEAIQKGAYTYLTKPFDDGELIHHVQLGCEKNRLTEEINALKQMLQSKFGFDNIIAKDEKMIAVLKSVIQASQIDSTILLQGESGTGKELMAKSIHVASARRDAPFIAVNCAAIPEALFESELFGVKKGAFTGADKDKIGFLEKAENGSFFFDEISEIPISTQAKLLRALQENEFYPLGGNEKIKLKARIIAATNTNLEEEVKKNRFRQDLYYRIRVIPITLPPLRERRACIPLLTHCFLAQFSREMNRNVTRFSEAAMTKLCQAPWPGNIRELKNVVEYCVAMSQTKTIPEELVLMGEEPPRTDLKPFKEAKRDFEKKYIIELLTLTSGNVSQAAKMAGKYRADFYEQMKKCDLNAEDFRG
ncbi:MAG: sigma-54-dependent Fis family transcriptional regulator [Desulfobacter sp.]|nr:MAG: sigma-54-dependent Fis family transcriptional regulator [Desulfobacter sp.]